MTVEMNIFNKLSYFICTNTESPLFQSTLAHIYSGEQSIMANVTISNLTPAGSELFQGEDSFIHELSEQEISDVLGGGRVQILWTAVCVEW